MRPFWEGFRRGTFMVWVVCGIPAAIALALIGITTNAAIPFIGAGLCVVGFVIAAFGVGKYW